MNTRDEVLRPFEKNRALMEDRIASGIEANRKGLTTLRFTGKYGKCIPGVKVHAKQKNHAFKVGANLFMLKEFDHAEQNDAYEKYFADAFNVATLP